MNFLDQIEQSPPPEANQNTGSMNSLGPVFSSTPDFTPIADPAIKGQLDVRSEQEQDRPIRAWMNDQWFMRIPASAGLSIAKNTLKLGEALTVVKDGASESIPQVDDDKMPWYEQIASGLLELGLPLAGVSKLGKAAGLTDKVSKIPGVSGSLARLGYRTGEFAAAAPFGMDVGHNITGLVRDMKDDLAEITSPETAESVSNFIEPLAINKDDPYWTKLGKTIIEGAALNEFTRAIVVGTIRGIRKVRSNPDAPNYDGKWEANMRKNGFDEADIEAMRQGGIANTDVRLASAAEVSDVVNKQSWLSKFTQGIADQDYRLLEFNRAGRKLQKAEKIDLGFVTENDKFKITPHQAAGLISSTGRRVEEYMSRVVLPNLRPVIDKQLLPEFMNWWHFKTIRLRQEQGIKTPYDVIKDQSGKVIQEGKIPDEIITRIVNAGDKNQSFGETLKKLWSLNDDMLDTLQAESKMWSPEQLKNLKENRKYALSLYRRLDDEYVSIGENFTTRTYKKDPTRRALEGSLNQETHFMDPLEAYIKNIAGLFEAAATTKAQRVFFDRIDALVKAGGAAEKEAYKWAVPITDRVKLNYAKKAILEAAKKEGVEITPDTEGLAAKLAEGSSDEAKKLKQFNPTQKDLAEKKIALDQASEAKLKAGLDIELENHEWINLQNKYVKPGKGTNIQLVIKDGQLMAYEIRDQGIATAMAKYGPRAATFLTRLPIVGSMTTGAKTLFTNLVTKNPEFAFISNPIRDTQSAFFLGVRGVSIPIVNVIRGLALQSKNNPVYRDFLKHAGWSNLSYGEKDTAKVFSNKFYNEVMNSDKFFVNSPKKLAGMYNSVIEKVENAVRVDYFNQLVKQGYATEVAAHHARNISTDFARTGSNILVKELSAIIPFFNASIQGSYRLLRGIGESFREGDKSFLKTKLMFGVVLPSMALHFYNLKDPKYQNYPDWMRDTNFMFNTNSIRAVMEDLIGRSPWDHDKNLEYFKIPKAHEIGAVATIAEKLIDGIIKKDGMVAAEAIIKTIMTMVRADNSSSFVPQIVRPIVEVMRNESSLGQPITPPNMIGSPESQFQPWTSNTSIGLAKLQAGGRRLLNSSPDAGLSPVEIEHLLYGYLGGVWGLLDDFLVSPTVGKAIGAPERPTRATSEQFAMRRLFSEADPRNSQPVSDLFKLEKLSEDVEKTLSPMLGQSKANMFKTLSNLEVKDMQAQLENPKIMEYLAARPLLRESMETIAELNQNIKVVWYSQSSRDEKRAMIDQINEAKNTLASQIVEALYRDPSTQHIAVDRDRKTFVGKYLGFRMPIAPEGTKEYIEKTIENLPDTLGINKLRGK